MARVRSTLARNGIAILACPGAQRLIEPVVKWTQQVVSMNTLHETIVRAGGMAQRTPKEPTYLCVPIETMLEPW